ncbi:hypothetical protein Nepgr_020746 [Nepenthes gracilis]|uniref:Uncharacterized protein n=1 Tax=Nepenthes gracilis TaxID=150966 RepID=A0AAD3SVU1_NEPGR|nr:hypothetical protein Nepgr_020746 [Nepenthes gracilis]
MDGVFSPESSAGPPYDFAMDLDYMDDVLLRGCWLETMDGSDFLAQSPGAFFEPSCIWSMLENNDSKSNTAPFEKNNQERQKSDIPESSAVLDPRPGALVSRSPSQNTDSSKQLRNVFTEGSELNRMYWIGPRANTGPSSSVMERLIRALGYIKDLSNKDILIQIWVPVNAGGTRILTTSNQPFLLDPNNPRLTSYRNISVSYQFAAEEDSNVTLGLPGRVFTGKVPEWTPDVRYFRVDEYPRVGHAQQFDVRGTLALPVFEQGSQSCLGVIEFVTTTQKVNYHRELESVCKALQAVDLRSSEFPSACNVKNCNSSYQAALPEILDVLKSACAAHGLPLAQTWMACVEQGKEGCRHSDENLIRCVSTVDSACFVADPQIQGFHEACSEHHLLKSQGVAGRAFMTNQPCFSSDITAYSKTEYPLSHHARLFGLCAAVAIRLRSIYSGTSEFVLEFFLPSSCRDPKEQKKILSSLSFIMEGVCRSLRVVTDEELAQENVTTDNNVIVISDDSANHDKLSQVNNIASLSSSSSQGEYVPAVQQKSAIVATMLKEQREISTGKSPELRQRQRDTEICETGLPNSGKSGVKKQIKAETSITLEVIRQHFAGSLKDTAKSIGVCPTTLKRICRQHGIKRWPARKIKKVGHSLKKLQGVINLVQGASGALQIGSFYSSFPELAPPNLSRMSQISATKPCPQLPIQEPEQGGSLSPDTATSKSPSLCCSQSSSSSQCCSTGTSHHPLIWNMSALDDHLAGENLSKCALKQGSSEAELHGLSQEEIKLLPRSRSHKSLVEHQNANTLPPLLKHGGMAFQEGDAWRVKVTFGEEKVRFHMLKSWRFKDLVQEVVRRFNIGDINGFHLKYLDDDSEWVLLTCDADLEECIDVCRSMEPQAIKLSLQVSCSPHRSSVGR